MLTSFQRIMTAWRAVIDPREICVCGHPSEDHLHRLECLRCDCCMQFVDQNDLRLPDWPGAA